VCVLHSVEVQYVYTAQSRGHCVCVLHGLVRHFLCTAMSSEVLCVNCTL